MDPLQSLCNIAYSAPAYWGQRVDVQNFFGDLRSAAAKLDAVYGMGNLIKLAEDAALFLYLVTGARSFTDVAVYVGTFVKLQCGDEPLIYKCNIDMLLAAYTDILAEESVQSLGEVLGESRKALDNFKTCLNSKIATKIRKMTLACVSVGLFEKLNIDTRKLGYSEFEVMHAKRTVPSGVDFGYMVLDTILFLLERANVAAATGNVFSIFHSGDRYEEWSRECLELKRMSKLLNDPSHHGFSEPEFYRRLDDALEIGRQIVKLANNFHGAEKKACVYQLNDLLMLRDDLVVKKAAREPRKNPFPILYVGKTSIGKSSLIDITFHYIAKLLDLPSDPSYKYTKNGFAEFWDGFKTSQWCVVIDDIAFMNPNTASSSGGDPSVMEIIQINNSVNYVPNQAALEDKGRIPLKNRVTLATTNTKHLNAQFYFSYPVAVLRRFPYVIHVTPKPQYATGGMLDSEKARNATDPHDLWHFKVEKIIGVKKDGKDPLFEEIPEFDNLNNYLTWLGKTILAFEANQERVIKQLNGLEFTVCKNCCSISGCDCEMIQSRGPYEDDPRVRYFNAANALFHCIDYRGRKYFYVWSRTGGWKYDREFDVKVRTMFGFVDVEQMLNVDYKEPWEDAHNYGRTYMISGVAHPNPKYDWDDAPLWANVLELALMETNSHMLHPFPLPEVVEEKEDVQAYEEIAGYGTKYERMCNITSSFFWWKVRQVRDMGIAWSGIFALALMRTFPGLASIIFSLIAFDLIPHLSKYPVFWRILGNSVVKKIRQPTWVVPAISGLTLVLAGYWCVLKLRGNVVEDLVENHQSVDEVEKTVGRKPEKSEEDEKRENVWYKDDWKLSPVDLSPQITSNAAQSREYFEEKLEKHLVHGKFVSPIDEHRNYVREARMIAVGGQVLLTNNHCVPMKPKMRLRVVVSDQMGQVGSNFEVDVFESEILRFPDRDLAFVRVRCLKLFANIDHLFPKISYRGKFDGTWMTRTPYGVIERRKIVALVPASFSSKDLVNLKTHVFRGYVDKPTNDGDCGSLYVQHTPSGHLLLGIHVAGGMNTAVCVPVDSVIVEKALTHFDKFKVQAGRIMISEKLGPMHPKCPLRYIEESGYMESYGSLKNYHTIKGSNVVPTLLQKFLVREKGFVVKHGPPLMSGWIPKRRAFVDLVKPQTTGIDLELLDDCVRTFAEDVWNELSVESRKMIHIVDLDTALNGAPGIPFMERMNMSTSSGYPYSVPKRQLCLGDNEHWDLPPDVLERVRIAIRDGMEEGMSTDFVFDGAKKDEPTPFNKIEEGKTRIFNVGSIESMIIGRMLFMGFMRCIMSNRFAFEVAIGVNCQSAEWEEIYQYLMSVCKGNYIAGDYKGFDKTQPSPFTQASMMFFQILAEKAGWSHAELRFLRAYGLSLCFPIINMFGDIVRLMKSNPSGCAVTTPMNCVDNSLFFRYAFVKEYRALKLTYLGENPLPLFKKLVKLLVLGDDNVGAVDARVDWFNHISIANQLKTIGVEYTMAEKDAKLVPYIPFEQVTFLKRKWVYDLRFESFACPLEWKSIEKMLLMCVKSKSISMEEHDVAVISAALREAYQHGDEQYDYLYEILWEAVDACGLRPYVTRATFPSKERLLYDWRRCSVNAMARMGKPLEFDTLDDEREDVELFVQGNSFAEHRRNQDRERRVRNLRIEIQDSSEPSSPEENIRMTQAFTFEDVFGTEEESIVSQEERHGVERNWRESSTQTSDDESESVDSAYDPPTGYWAYPPHLEIPTRRPPTPRPGQRSLRMVSRGIASNQFFETEFWRRSWDSLIVNFDHFYRVERRNVLMTLCWVFPCVCRRCLNVQGHPLSDIFGCDSEEDCHICNEVFGRSPFCYREGARDHRSVFYLDLETVTVLTGMLWPVVMRGFLVENPPGRSPESFLRDGLADSQTEQSPGEEED